MKTDEIRQRYLDFFVSQGHRRCESDVLVPTWDPSVLFTPAGMNQFKDHFLGKVKLDFTRATSCQKCLRTGDIDNVGRTAYHHTFFEMLGNFSFGDYFKREAIVWAWEFLTSEKWLNLPADRLSVSVYTDDDEAARVWGDDVGLPGERIVRMGEEDNFWPAGAPTHGPDGVCGPCSEIFFRTDSGNEVEIWNLVFTQFNRVGEPPNNLRPLPSRNIDTGMGLERTASVMQNVDTNFHIDILRPIVEAAAAACRIEYVPSSDAGRRLRRITDHVRACTMAIHENVYPGPNKEKYVIRRLLRRAVLDGHQLGMREPFVHKLVPVVVDMMKAPYPELTGSVERVAAVIRQEEESTLATIESGLPRAERLLDQLQEAGRTTLDGHQAAHLYSTYGFPPELMESLAVERRIAFDWEGFQQALRVDSDEAHVLFKEGPVEQLKKTLQSTEFLGYEATEAMAEVKGLVADDKLLNELQGVGERQMVVLDRSPFYGEAGGQVGDVGVLEGPDGRFQIDDTQREGLLLLHYGRLVQGRLRTGDQVRAVVDAQRREGIRRAHSATHILHYALQKILGSHAQQQGSKVDQDWLRFDFTNLSPVDEEQIDRIEEDVVARIGAREEIASAVLPLAEARQQGAMMLFGEKYPDPVRMVSMGQFSRELCGGTHLHNTGEVGAFEIISEEGVSAGTRRVVAVTGPKAIAHRERTIQTAQQAARQLGCAPAQLPHAVRRLAERVRDLKKQLAGSTTKSQPLPGTWPAESPKNGSQYTHLRTALRESARQLNIGPFDLPDRVAGLLQEMRSAEEQLQRRDEVGTLSVDDLLQRAQDVGGTQVIVAEIPLAGANLMRQLIDQIRRKRAPTAVLLMSREDSGKVTLVAGLSRDLVSRGLSAGNWVKAVAPAVDGGGGGKPDMAQAGGKSAEKIPLALEEAQRWILAQLAG